MKHPRLSLVRNLRTLFGAARIFCFIALLISPLSLVLPMPGYASADIRFEPSGLKITQDAHPATAEFRLSSLTGNVRASEGRAGNADFERFNRRILLPSLLLTYLLWFAVSDLLWRLCRNIERGEVFTDANLKLLRWLGIAVIVSSYLLAAVRGWENLRVQQFVLQHVRFEGLTLAPAEGGIHHLLLSLPLFNTSILTGLLIFVVAEVFRQGLALKQEADLTV